MYSHRLVLQLFSNFAQTSLAFACRSRILATHFGKCGNFSHFPMHNLRACLFRVFFPPWICYRITQLQLRYVRCVGVTWLGNVNWHSPASLASFFPVAFLHATAGHSINPVQPILLSGHIACHWDWAFNWVRPLCNYTEIKRKGFCKFKI